LRYDSKALVLNLIKSKLRLAVEMSDT